MRLKQEASFFACEQYMFRHFRMIQILSSRTIQNYPTPNPIGLALTLHIPKVCFRSRRRQSRLAIQTVTVYQKCVWSRDAEGVSTLKP